MYRKNTHYYITYDTATGRKKIHLPPTSSKPRQRPEVAYLSYWQQEQEPYYDRGSTASKARSPADCVQPSCPSLLRPARASSACLAGRPNRRSSCEPRISLAFRGRHASTPAVSHRATRLNGGGRSPASPRAHATLHISPSPSPPPPEPWERSRAIAHSRRRAIC
jgi:hypothetical protein